jgi:hypothetical protein
MRRQTHELIGKMRKIKNNAVYITFSHNNCAPLNNGNPASCTCVKTQEAFST